MKFDRTYFGPIIIWVIVGILGNYIPMESSADFPYVFIWAIMIGFFGLILSALTFVIAIFSGPKLDKRFRSGFRDITKDGYVYNDGSLQEGSANFTIKCIKFSIGIAWMGLGTLVIIPLFIYIPKLYKFSFLFSDSSTFIKTMKESWRIGYENGKNLKNKSDFEIAREQVDQVKNQTQTKSQENKSDFEIAREQADQVKNQPQTKSQENKSVFEIAREQADQVKNQPQTKSQENKSVFEIAREQADQVKNQPQTKSQENKGEKEEINLTEEFLSRAIESVHNSDYKNAIKHSKAVLAIDSENEEAKTILGAAESAEKNQ